MTPNIYDDLDLLYREVWGRSLHHGLWQKKNDNIPQAQETLENLVLQLTPSHGTIADIGCGYGTLAHRLIQNSDCRIIAITNSPVQAEKIQPDQNLKILTGDWLDQALATESLDGAVAIESLSHFPSFEDFLTHTFSSLKKGSRLTIADWFSETGSHPLLRHLAGTGTLPTWRSLDSLIRSATNLGFTVRDSRDISKNVAPTWSRIFLRSVTLPLRSPLLFPSLLKQLLLKPSLLWAFPLLRLAFHTGDLQYHLVSLEK